MNFACQLLAVLRPRLSPRCTPYASWQHGEKLQSSPPDLIPQETLVADIVIKSVGFVVTVRLCVLFVVQVIAALKWAWCSGLLLRVACLALFTLVAL